MTEVLVRPGGSPSTQDQREPTAELFVVAVGAAGSSIVPTVIFAGGAELTVLADDQASGYVDADLVEGLPRWIVAAYARRAARHARVREVDPGVWTATVVGLDGAYGDGGTADEAEADLQEAVAGWVAVRRRLGLKVPVLEGLDLNLPANPGPA